MDTLSIKSPRLEADQISVIKEKLVKKSAVSNIDGKILYEVHNGIIDESWKTGIWVQVYNADQVIVTASVNKLLIGHNVVGGFRSAKAGAIYLVNIIARYFNINMPDYSEWEYQRIDKSDNYILESEKKVIDVIDSIKLTKAGRKQLRIPGKTSVKAETKRGGIIIYAKGPEFIKHDYKSYSEDDAEYIRELAKKILRVETRIRGMQVKELCGTKVISKVKEDVIDTWLAKQKGDLMQEMKTEFHVVRTDKEVMERLKQLYSDRKAVILYASWVTISTMGDEGLKRALKRASYYNHKRELKQAGISWLGTNVQRFDEPGIENGFTILGEWRKTEAPIWVKELEEKLLSA